MIPISAVQTGVARYLAAEIEPKIGGIGRWIVGAAAGAYLAELPGIVSQLKDHPMIKALHIIGEDGSVDIDKLYQYIKAQADKAPASLDIPLLGRLSLGPADVDALYTYIRQS